MSWIEISKELKTYPNKIRREAKRLNIPSRDKSCSPERQPWVRGGQFIQPKESQFQKRQNLKLAKVRVSYGTPLPKRKGLVRSQIGKMSWDKKTEEEKRDLIRKGGDAIRDRLLKKDLNWKDFYLKSSHEESIGYNSIRSIG